MELYKQNAAMLSARMQVGDVSATELCGAILARTEQVECAVGAYVSLNPEGAMRAAEGVDARRTRNEPIHPLAGIPIALSDNLCVKGQSASAACEPMFGSVHLCDAAMVELCADAGLVILGKTNMDELSIGKRCADTPAGKTRNPYDLSRVPGGSCGGSAAAVAAGEAVLALGTDYDGSIRIPAAYCGVVALRPTWGAVPGSGLLSIVPSMEQIGFLARSVSDLGWMTRLFCAGERTRMKQNARLKDMGLDAPSYRLEGLRVGLPKQFFTGEPDTDESVEIGYAAECFRDLGAKLVELDFPVLRDAPAIHYALACAETAARAEKRRIAGIPYDFMADEMLRIIRKDLSAVGPAVKEMLIAGAYALSPGRIQTTYHLAVKRREDIVRTFEAAFAKCDILLAPGSTQVAPPVLPERPEDQTHLRNPSYSGVDLARLPALSLPCGFAHGMPVGLQMIAPAWHDHLLLNVGYAFERTYGVCGEPARVNLA